jgi:hypothetical protein
MPYTFNRPVVALTKTLSTPLPQLSVVISGEPVAPALLIV